MTDSTLQGLEVAGFLFDMDGTLVDSTALVEEAWTAFAAAHGLDAAAILAYAHGRQTKDTLRRFLPAASDAELIAIEASMEAADDQGRVVEIPGAAALVRRLDAIGAPWAVVTSAGRALAARRLLGAGIGVPTVLIGAEDVARGKPAPDGYRDAAAALGVDVAACVVLEDAEAGLQAAIDSGGVPVVVGALASPNTEGVLRVTDLRDLGVIGRSQGFLLTGL